MNSVLLVGHDSFLAGVQSQVRSLNSLTVIVAESASKAVPLFKNHPPDVVIVQVDFLIERSVTKTFSQNQAAYIVVIDISQPSGNATADQVKTLDETAAALESGADAYLWLPQKQTLPGLTFQEDQRRLIQAHIQLGLGQAQRYRDLSRINDWLSAVALVDALTQLNNRRAFDLELPNQIQLARTKNTPLSLMVLDIDHFKSVNDRFGHLVGDDMLKQLAQRLLTNMRFYDTPFRYGGEEFVVILPNTGLAEGQGIANRICETVAKEPFGLTLPVNGVGTLEMTLSAGITELRSDDDKQGRSFVGRADQNLLTAKAAGRNQVVAT